MRIGILASEFYPDIGGVETYALEFCKELISRGHEVYVFTVKHAQGEAVIPGAKVLPILRRRRRLDSKALGGYDMDVWHSMNAAYAWLSLEKKNVIVSVHGNDFLRSYIPVGGNDIFARYLPFIGDKLCSYLDKRLNNYQTKKLLVKAFMNAKHIVANSEYTERVFLDKYIFCKGKTSVGYVGVRGDFFSIVHVKRQNDRVHLITISRLSEKRKNIDKVLCALSTLTNEYDFFYTIVGDGYLRHELEALANKYGLSDKVNFSGFVSDSELFGLLSESDLFVLTSSIDAYSHEGFGIAYIEANAAGIPVLAARLAGAIEAVDEDASGWFVDSPDCNEIAQQLRRYFTGEVVFNSEDCKTHARKFSWGSVVEHVEHYY